MDAALNFAPCGYVSFTSEGTIIAANHTLSKLLEYADDSLVGKNIEQIFPIASRIFYNTHLAPLLCLQNNAEEIFISLRSRNNVNIPVVSNFVRRQENEEIIFFATFIVVVRRKRFEDELLSSKKLLESNGNKSDEVSELKLSLELLTQEFDRQLIKQAIISQNIAQFSKIVSHDLHEPIRKIKIFLEQVSSEDLDSDKAKMLLSKIGKANERIELLVKGLFQFIEVDTSKPLCSVNLNLEFEKAQTLATSTSGFDDFSIDLADLPSIKGHDAQILLLFYHLILNSIQFREPARKLSLKVSCVIVEENSYQATPDRYRYVEHVKITISDNGIGFENQYNNYVFDMASKIDGKTNGIGVGLSLAKKIVENHFGSIRIQSEPNKGTSVMILIPLGET
jgi:sigma-B regulation protein RsbU (phosphoserine phosphatase)